MRRFTRISSGIGCMICVAWGVYNYRDGEIPFEPLVTFLGLFSFWLFGEVTSSTPSPRNALHPSDIKLGNKLRSNFDQQTRYRLRHHSFGQPYNDEWIDPLRRFNRENEGAESQFENDELETIRNVIITSIDDLDDKLSIYSAMAENHPMHYYSIPNPSERANDWFSSETRKRVDEVNQISSEIIANIDAFEKKFRELSPESFE